MAAPTAPTLTTLVTEALKKTGDSSPTAADISRASDYWMEEIKNDIWTVAKKLKSLQTTAIAIANKGQSKYSNPTDYSSDLSMQLLDGTITGTAQAGSATTITLAANDTSEENDIVGREILITAGTGAGSIGQATAYNSTTKVATVSPAFDTAPGLGSTYLVITSTYMVQQGNLWDLDRQVYPMSKERPTYYHPIGDADYGEFIFNSAPDKTYGIKFRYYANLLTLDLDGTLMSTLYQRWRNVFINGIVAKRWAEDSDNRFQQQEQVFRGSMMALVNREQYGAEWLGNQAKVVDY